MEELETGSIINTYETIIIFDPYHYEGNVEIFEDMCQEFTGKKYKIKKEVLGVKKLAYEIKTFKEGYYVVFTWQGIAEHVHELERCLRINDSVIKFITVKRDDEIAFEARDYVESEQNVPEEKPDALDVMLGFADYKKKGVK